MRIAMIGTRGVPPQYGGFETAVEEIGQRLAAAGHEVVVYCRNPGQNLKSHRGMTLVNLPAIRSRTLETLSHSGLSCVHAILGERPDAAFVFNAANAPFLPFLRAAGIPAAVHLDGLEWQRSKWAGVGSRYYRWAERQSVAHADFLIADAQAIANHVVRDYGVDPVLIPYGAPMTRGKAERIETLDLRSDQYHLAVARFEPENHVREIVQGYVDTEAELPLVVVGSSPYSREYTAAVHASAKGDRRVRFVGSLWDEETLDSLYGHARSYLHGHSVGGTNPSLLRAMGAGAATSAYDCEFNREVTGCHARFFRSALEVGAALMADETNPHDARARGDSGRAHVAGTYDWDEVSARYEALALEMQYLGSRHPR